MTLRAGVGRAHGKIILFGEHAVVHGTKAVGAALSQGITTTARADDGNVLLDAPNWHLRVGTDDDTPPAKSLRAIADALSLSLDDVRFTVETAIPARAGLGSSAAMAASVARALTSFHRCDTSLERLFDAVQASERIFHHNPSGLDASVALEGGLLVYSKSQGTRSLTLEVPPLMVVVTGEPGDTAEMVARFGAKLSRDPSEGGRRLDRIQEIVGEGLECLECSDHETLGRLMTENHELLRWFGVSSVALDEMVETALSAGALGAKLTGGGGGGSGIVLAPAKRDTIRDALIAKGFEVLTP